MFDDVAVPYLQDWELWEWLTAVGQLGAAVVVAAGWRTYLRWVAERTEHWLPTVAVPIVMGVGSLVGLLWLPHALMRRIPDQKTVGWLMLGLLAVAAALAVQAWLDAARGYTYGAVPRLGRTDCSGCRHRSRRR